MTNKVDNEDASLASTPKSVETKTPSAIIEQMNDVGDEDMPSHTSSSDVPSPVEPSASNGNKEMSDKQEPLALTLKRTFGKLSETEEEEPLASNIGDASEQVSLSKPNPQDEVVSGIVAEATTEVLPILAKRKSRGRPRKTPVESEVLSPGQPQAISSIQPKPKGKSPGRPKGKSPGRPKKIISPDQLQEGGEVKRRLPGRPKGSLNKFPKRAKKNPSSTPALLIINSSTAPSLASSPTLADFIPSPANSNRRSSSFSSVESSPFPRSLSSLMSMPLSQSETAPSELLSVSSPSFSLRTLPESMFDGSSPSCSSSSSSSSPSFPSLVAVPLSAVPSLAISPLPDFVASAIPSALPSPVSRPPSSPQTMSKPSVFPSFLSPLIVPSVDFIKRKRGRPKKDSITASSLALPSPTSPT